MELTKDTARALLQQASSLLALFGGVHPKLQAVANMLNAFCDPEVFDTIWAVVSSNPKIQAAMNDAITKPGESVFEAMGNRINVNLGVSAAAKSANYYKTRQGMAAILALAQTWAMFTTSQTDDAYVQFAARLIWTHFDEVWAIDHPEDA